MSSPYISRSPYRSTRVESLELREEAINKESAIFLKEKTDQLNQFKREVESKEGLILANDAEISAQRRVIDSLEARLGESERTRVALLRQIGDLEAEENRLTNRVSELELLVRDANNVETRLLNEVTELQTRVSRMVPKTELDEARRSLNRSTVDLAELRQSNSKMSKELSESQSEVAYLSNSIRSKEQELDSLSRSIVAKDGELQEERLGRSRVETDYKEISEKLNLERNENDNLQRDIDRYSRLLTDTNERLDRTSRDVSVERSERVRLEHEREEAAKRRLEILNSRCAIEQKLGESVRAVSPKPVRPSASSVSYSPYRHVANSATIPTSPSNNLTASALENSVGPISRTPNPLSASQLSHRSPARRSPPTSPATLRSIRRNLSPKRA